MLLLHFLLYFPPYLLLQLAQLKLLFQQGEGQEETSWDLKNQHKTQYHLKDTIKKK